MHNIKTNKAIVGIIGVVLIVVLWNLLGENSFEKKSVAERVVGDNELRVGYIIYPPDLIRDEKTGQLSGISYDIVEESAKRLGLKTNWVEAVGWGTAIEGLKNGRYDILGTRMSPNTTRAREAIFSEAPFLDSLYLYVRVGDKRIAADFSNLDSNKFIVSLIEGDIHGKIVKDQFPSVRTVTEPQLAPYSNVLSNVVTKKADVVFAEPTGIAPFMKNNPGQLEKLSNIPLRTYENTYVFARGEYEMRDMWNVALQELISEGKIEKILDKYGVKENYVLNK